MPDRRSEILIRAMEPADIPDLTGLTEASPGIRKRRFHALVHERRPATRSRRIRAAVSRLPKRTRTALGKEGAKAARRKRRRR